MEYFLIIFWQLLGVSFHVGQKIVSLGDKFPEKNVNEIGKTFWKEDWDTLLISFLIIMLDLGTHFTLHYLKIELPAEEWYWKVMPYAAALILGYAGQRLVYKWFGSAEEFLDKQVTDRLGVRTEPPRP